MTKTHKIRTPIPMLQIITAGGLRFSTLVELWGPNRAGKSTVCYQTAGYFLQDYGDKARLKILDSESSVDELRLIETFGINSSDPRVEIKPAHFLEDGFLRIMDWIRDLSDDEFMMVIWDTMSASPTQSSFNATQQDARQQGSRSKGDGEEKKKKNQSINMFSGGMQDRPRVIKFCLRQIMSDIYGKNVTVWLPNQVFSSMTPYGASEVRGEGSALQHDIHYSLRFKRLKVDTDGELIANFTMSQVSLVKSKFSPEFQKSPLFIDNVSGGLIVESMSIFLLARDMNLIEEYGGGWFNVKDTDGNLVFEKKKQWKDLVASEEAYKALLLKLTKSVRQKFRIVNRIYEMDGFPPVEEPDRPSNLGSKGIMYDLRSCVKNGGDQNEKKQKKEDKKEKGAGELPA